MNQEYPVNTQNHQTQEKPHPIVTTQERAEQYTIERLNSLLNDGLKHLRNTAPYHEFEDILYCSLNELFAP